MPLPGSLRLSYTPVTSPTSPTGGRPCCRAAVTGETCERRCCEPPPDACAAGTTTKALEPSGGGEVGRWSRLAGVTSRRRPGGRAPRLSLLYDSGGGWGPNRPLRTSGSSSVRSALHVRRARKWALNQLWISRFGVLSCDFFVRGAQQRAGSKSQDGSGRKNVTARPQARHGRSARRRAPRLGMPGHRQRPRRRPESARLGSQRNLTGSLAGRAAPSVRAWRCHGRTRPATHEHGTP